MSESFISLVEAVLAQQEKTVGGGGHNVPPQPE